MNNSLSLALVAGLSLLAGQGQANTEAAVTLPGTAVQMEFVRIDPGAFTMGDSIVYTPPRAVTITRPFYLAKYEVTQQQWEGVMGTRPWSGKPSVEDNPSHPAVFISWEAAQAFIEKINQASTHDAYRLPTEAEWEYACRAGTTTPWYFGVDADQLQSYAWTYEQGFLGQTVGLKLPNPWGLYDMHGNVWEWCQDWSGEYQDGAQVDPTGPASGTQRVFRGGGFNNQSVGALWSSSRRAGGPAFGYAYLGLRLAWDGGGGATAVTPANWGEVKGNR